MIRRSIFTFFAAISFVLFAAVATLAIRSASHAETIGNFGGVEDIWEFSGIGSSRGGLWIGRWIIDWGDFSPMRSEDGWMWNLSDADSTLDHSGRFDAGWGQADPAATRWYTGATKKDYFIKAPHWAFAIVLAIAPLAWLIALRKRLQIRRRGECRVCGYDLRATPERCPECGAVPLP